MESFTAIPIEHPLGEFYLTALPAQLLVECAYSDPLCSNDGVLAGLERKLDEKRADDIGEYIKTVEAVFPGTIILAANWLKNNEPLLEDDPRRWRIAQIEGADLVELKIPERAHVATIVDGQHRVGGFKRVKGTSFCDIKMPCAIFFGLPPPQQATIFATINSNQKPVSKSLTYALFGYNLKREDPKYWTPEKLAVFLTRKLNGEKGSPFEGHIKVAAVEGRLITGDNANGEKWAVSTATIVEGFLSLFSRKPKDDRNLMMSGLFTNRSILKGQTDHTPLRQAFINGYDGLIYDVVKNFFTVVNKKLWESPDNVVLRKTAGVQALFGVLQTLLPKCLENGDVRESVWESALQPVWNCKLSFSHPYFHDTSARGRGQIKDAILVAVGAKKIEQVRGDSQKFLSKIFS